MTIDQRSFTREQQQAARALANVQKVDQAYSKGGSDEKERMRYGSMAHSLPIMIRTAGLAQALAFVQSRKKPGTDLLLDHLAQSVLGAEARGSELCNKAITTPDLRDYMLLTERVLAALLWYKRFVQSILKIETTTEVPE
jgi:CRISPR-associated protein Cmr5